MLFEYICCNIPPLIRVVLGAVHIRSEYTALCVDMRYESMISEIVQPYPPD